MADGVPLNLLLEPGEYRVEWQLPTQTGGTVALLGDLELVADRPPRGNVFGNVPVKWETAGAGGVASFPQIYEASTVVGRLLNGFTVILIGAVIEIWMSERAVIHARAALLGREPVAADTMQVVGVDVQV